MDHSPRRSTSLSKSVRRCASNVYTQHAHSVREFNNEATSHVALANPMLLGARANSCSSLHSSSESLRARSQVPRADSSGLGTKSKDARTHINTPDEVSRTCVPRGSQNSHHRYHVDQNENKGSASSEAITSHPYAGVTNVPPQGSFDDLALPGTPNTSYHLPDLRSPSLTLPLDARGRISSPKRHVNTPNLSHYPPERHATGGIPVPPQNRSQNSIEDTVAYHMSNQGQPSTGNRSLHVAQRDSVTTNPECESFTLSRSQEVVDFSRCGQPSVVEATHGPREDRRVRCLVNKI